MADHGRHPPPRDDSAADDEISLLDLWLVLHRRRRWLMAVALGALLLAAGVLLVRPAAYDYRSAIDLGSYINAEDERVFLEAPGSFLDKLRQAYVPRARQQFRQAAGAEASPPGIAVSRAEDSALFILETRAATGRAEAIEQVHARAVGMALDGHDSRLDAVLADRRGSLERARIRVDYLEDERIRPARLREASERVAAAGREIEAVQQRFEAQRRQLDEELASTRLRAQALESQEALLETRMDRLDGREALVERQIREYRPLAESLFARLPAADADADALASMLLATTQAAEVQRRLDTLEREQVLGIPETRSELAERIEETRREQSKVNVRLDNLQAEIERARRSYRRELAGAESALGTAEVRLGQAEADFARELDEAREAVASAQRAVAAPIPTEALFTAIRSLEPRGPGAGTVLALGAILGLLLGVFAAFGAELMASIRERIASADTT